MDKNIDLISARLRGAIKVLIVDDFDLLLTAVAGLFNSPFFEVTAVDSFEGAKRVIEQKGSQYWNAAILDMDLGEGPSGLDLMPLLKNVPVCVLSGLQSMSVAAEAMKRGAVAVFDKSPTAFLPLYEETCCAASLADVMGTQQTQYKHIFHLITQTTTKSIDDWASAACLSTRQLHRVCDLHPWQDPKLTLALFYTISVCLWKDAKPTREGFPRPLTIDDELFIKQCFEYSLKWIVKKT